ncbi:MAG: IS630 family transposase [Bdellovibrionales bacterium]
MTKPYSEDLRSRVIKEIGKGTSCRRAAALFGVSESSAIRWAQRWRRNGDYAALPQGGDNRSALRGEREWLLEQIKTVPDMTLMEIRKALGKRGIRVGCSTVWRFFDGEGISFKKTVYAVEQKRRDVAERRTAWLAAQKTFDPEKLLFVDETWIKTNMARTHGRCRIGERLLDFVPHGHWQTLTFIAALRHDRITAPWIVDGPINGDIFKVYVRDVLCPVLKPGDIVVMDNLGSHKSPVIRELIEAKGATLLYLPPYSPDLNPIEPGYSKIKAALHKAARRSVDALSNAVASALNTFSPRQCTSFFSRAGYASV